MTTLEKIRAEIENQLFVGRIINPKEFDNGLKWCLELFDKYAEQEPCEVSEYDKDHIWYKGHQYISLRRFLEVKAEAEQEPCEDAVSRQAVLDLFEHYCGTAKICNYNQLFDDVKQLPPVRPQEQTGHCKDCKYFEYDSVAKSYKVPIIVAHEICSKWGDGCKTREDGYCFLFEPQKSEVRNEHKV